MLFAFTFLAVNNLDFKKQQNLLKLHRAEQQVFLAGPPVLTLIRIRPSYGHFPNTFTMKACMGPYIQAIIIIIFIVLVSCINSCCTYPCTCMSFDQYPIPHGSTVHAQDFHALCCTCICSHLNSAFPFQFLLADCFFFASRHCHE